MNTPITFVRNAFRVNPKFASIALSADAILGITAGTAAYLTLNMAEFEVTRVAFLLVGFAMMVVAVLAALYAYTARNFAALDDDGMSDYDRGYLEGETFGYDQGHDEGYREGYDQGHDEGYMARELED